MFETLKLLNFNNILISPINYFITLTFFLGLCFLTVKTQNILKIKNQTKFLECFLILICILVFLINLFLLFNIDLSKLRVFFYIISILGIFFIFYKKSLIIDYFKYLINKNNLIIKVFLIAIFLNSLLSPIDIDSLDYHLGFPGYIENNGFYSVQNNWFHSALFLNGEIIGLLGLIIKSDNFLNFLNFIAILIFFRTIELTKYKYQTKNIIKLLIISCPAIIQLILSAKPFLFPLSIMIYSFYQLKEILFTNTHKKKHFKETLSLFIIIFFACSFRYELFIFLFLILVYFTLYNKILVLYILKFSFIGFAISIFPIFLRNFIHFRDPIFPFLSKGNLSDGYTSFMEGLGSTGTLFGMDKILIFPLNLFFSVTPEYFITTLGFAIIPILLTLEKKFINKDMIIIFSYALVLIFLGKISYPRFFIPSFILFVIMCGSLIEKKKFKIFKYTLFGHVLFSFFILIYSLTIYGPMLINENLKSDILSKTVDNHYIYKSIYKNYSGNEKFFDITRSRNHFDKRRLNIKFDENYNDLNKSELLKLVSKKSGLIIIDKDFENFLIKKNINFKIIEEFDYKIFTRNPLFNKSIRVIIVKFNN